MTLAAQDDPGRPGLTAGRARLPLPLILGFLFVAGVIAAFASRDRTKRWQ